MPKYNNIEQARNPRIGRNGAYGMHSGEYCSIGGTIEPFYAHEFLQDGDVEGFFPGRKWAQYKWGQLAAWNEMDKRMKEMG